MTSIPSLIVESNNPKWRRALKAFQNAAKAYKVKYDRPMVIVYDNVSRLDPEIICILQNSAKDNADSRTYIAAFVSSEGSVPKIMESKYRHYFFSLRNSVTYCAIPI